MSNEPPLKKHFKSECDILEYCTKVRDIACYFLPRSDKINKVLRQMKVRYRKRQSSIDSAIRKQRRLSLGMENKFVFESLQLQNLLEALGSKGYRVVGPNVRDDAIVYDELTSASDLPVGWTDEQDGGGYRLKRRTDEAIFGYSIGPHSWKKFLLPPKLRLWQARREESGFQILAEDEDVPKLAFIGVRSCELHAIGIQDRIFVDGAQGAPVDPSYKARRENIFIVAVQCGQAGGTCFCVSMNTGPKATFGFDLALTEVLAGGRHYFVVEVGTKAGAEILREIPHSKANEVEKRTAEGVLVKTAAQMGRTMDTTDIKNLLYRNYEHPRWQHTAARCLTCANCTMVCPTCFCTTIEDTTDLTAERAERWRKWDSCFTLDFSYIHGGNVRSSPSARYRHWLTHKLATWIDQFGTSGCVGCGRCITWCPAAIDITEEVRTIRECEGVPTLGSRTK